MNKFNALILTSISIFASTAAFAGQSEGGLTRAEVQAEYQRARAAGEINDTGYTTAVTSKLSSVSTLSRADVMAEYQRALAAGELKVHNSGYSTATTSATPSASTLTREQVMSEYRRARDAGELRTLLGFSSAAQDAGHPVADRAQVLADTVPVDFLA